MMSANSPERRQFFSRISPSAGQTRLVIEKSLRPARSWGVKEPGTSPLM
jgi:hypothetical protein